MKTISGKLAWENQLQMSFKSSKKSFPPVFLQMLLTLLLLTYWIKPHCNSFQRRCSDLLYKNLLKSFAAFCFLWKCITVLPFEYVNVKADRNSDWQIVFSSISYSGIFFFKNDTKLNSRTDFYFHKICVPDRDASQSK